MAGSQGGHTRAVYGLIRDGRLQEATDMLQGVLRVGWALPNGSSLGGGGRQPRSHTKRQGVATLPVPWAPPLCFSCRWRQPTGRHCPCWHTATISERILRRQHTRKRQQPWPVALAAPLFLQLAVY